MIVAWFEITLIFCGPFMAVCVHDAVNRNRPKH